MSKSFKGSAFVSKNIMDNLEEEFYLKINGEIKQLGKSSEMIFSIERLIVYLSKFVALKKGDLIFTGTPSGVGKLSKKNVVEIGFSKNKNAEKYLVV